MFVLELIRVVKARRVSTFLAFCFFQICWYGCEFVTRCVPGIPSSHSFGGGPESMVWNLGMICVGFSMPLILLSLLHFYRPSFKPKWWFYALLFAIPVANAGMVFSSGYHELIRAIEVVGNNVPIRNTITTWGPWFTWVHTPYCYALAPAALYVIIAGHSKIPKFYRLPSYYMIAGIVLIFVCNILVIIPPVIVAGNFDITLMACSVFIFCAHLAMQNGERNLFIRYARKYVFRHMSQLVLVLGASGKVADHNPNAAQRFKSIGVDINLNDTTLSCILEGFKKIDAVFEGEVDGEFGLDIHFYEGKYKVVLNLSMHEMNDGKDHKLGTIAMFTDVTQNRSLIAQMEAKAGMDALTGLPNRMAYDGARARLNCKQELPLSVIVCDVNGLKEVNDTMGHRFGDMMLQSVAAAMESVCPKSAFVGRVGGDEFVYLLPKANLEAANALIQKIHTTVANVKDLPTMVSVAMGAATKYSENENLDEVITQADRLMYENKKIMKGFTEN